MALEFKDRVPQKPGRVKITPENGTPYYAVLERADEPIEEGTPLNAQNLNEMAGMIEAIDDHIVEHGYIDATEDNDGARTHWYYRKWESGLVEINGTYRARQVPVGTAFGQLFRSDSVTVNYPFNFMWSSDYEPIVNVFFITASGYGAMVWDMNHSETDVAVSLVRPTSGTADGHICIYVRGMLRE